MVFQKIVYIPSVWQFRERIVQSEILEFLIEGANSPIQKTIVYIVRFICRQCAAQLAAGIVFRAVIHTAEQRGPVDFDRQIGYACLRI